MASRQEVNQYRRAMRIRAFRRDGTTIGVVDVLIRGTTAVQRNDRAIEEAIRRWPNAHEWDVITEVVVQ